jgi:hypothetical protein
VVEGLWVACEACLKWRPPLPQKLLTLPLHVICLASTAFLPRRRRRLISNPSGTCSYQRPTRGTVCGTMCSMCSAELVVWQ